MNLHCAFHHEWVGCRCTRCGRIRDDHHEWETRNCRVVCARCGLIHAFAHDWEGCWCRACNEVRDVEHDPRLYGCEVLCSRCGRHIAFEHDWAECACTRCDTVHHDWKEGTCQRCGKACEHDVVEARAFGETTGTVTYVDRLKIDYCKACGMALGPHSTARH